MKLYIKRLKPGTDLKKELQTLVDSQRIMAGFLVSCVGSLSRVVLRMAGAEPGNEKIKSIDEKLEIVAVEGTLSQDGIHVHLSVSDRNGNVFGGHLKEGCLVDTTVELAVGESETHIFHRRLDEKTGFKELEIEEK